MILAVGAFVAFIAAIFIVTRFGLASLAVVGVIASLALFPRDLGGIRILGTALTTQMVAIVFLLIVSVLSIKRGGGLARLLPFGAVLLVLGPLVWIDYGSLPAGVFALVIAACGWMGGYFIGRIAMDDPRVERVIAVMVLLVVITQAVVTLLQTAGFDLFSTAGRTAELTEGRANGTLGHPGNLGKNLILVVLLVLPMTQAPSKSLRRIASCAVLVSLVPIGLSQSRTNFAAILALLALWALLLPRSKPLRTRIILPLSVLIVALLFLEPILTRFSADPVGGERDRFLAVALAYIPDNLWLGVGPNGYISYFGQFDALTAAGWPVHNAVLLTVAEVGVVGAVSLFVPTLIVPAVVALRALKTPESAGLHARAILSGVVAIVVLVSTGWGMVSPNVLPLWLFTAAYLESRCRPRRSPVGPVSDDYLAAYSRRLPEATLRVERSKGAGF